MQIFLSIFAKGLSTWAGKYWKPQCASNIFPDARAKIRTPIFPRLFPDFLVFQDRWELWSESNNEFWPLFKRIMHGLILDF